MLQIETPSILRQNDGILSYRRTEKSNSKNKQDRNKT